MFRTLPQERTFEALVKQIKEAIYSGKLKHGDKLPTERDLAQIFKVSRAAVRSAMLNLEQSGVLEIKKGAGGGFFIQDLNFKPVRDSLHHLIMLGRASISHFTEARRIIEPEAAALAALRATPKDIADLENAVRSFQHRAEEAAAPEPGDLQFHICIAQGAKNPVILVIMRSLMDLLFRSIASYPLDHERGEVIVAHHRAILGAIKVRNSDKARTLMLEHVTAMNAFFSDFEGDSENQDTTG
ncbi:MAG: FadR/GntR family transcriptional regulator [Desulfomonilaceae bacterium]